MNHSTIDNNFINPKENHPDSSVPLFEESTLAFFSDSIKLMRKDFPYQEIPYKNIQQVVISKGYSVKNKVLTTLIFSALFLVAVYVLYQKQNMLLSLPNRTISELFDSEIILYLLGPSIAIFVAISSIVSVFTTQPVFQFEVDNKIKETKLKEITKNDEFHDFLEFIQTKTKVLSDFL